MKNFILFLFLFWLIPASSLGQGISISPNIDLANNLFEQGSYKAAAKEYLRVYFYDRDNSEKEVSRKIAMSFDQLGRGQQALKYIKIYLRQQGIDDNSAADAYYHKLQILVKYVSIKHAISDFYQMPNQLVNNDLDRYNYYGSNLFLIDGDIDRAKKHVASLSYADQIDGIDMEKLLVDYQKNLDKNHVIPRLMSAGIPGLGQTVNGEVRDGLNSFLLNASLIALFIKVAQSLSPADAALSVAPWLGRYFLGGMGNASKASKKKQLRRKKEMHDSFNEFLQGAQLGKEKAGL